MPVNKKSLISSSVSTGSNFSKISGPVGSAVPSASLKTTKAAGLKTTKAAGLKTTKAAGLKTTKAAGLKTTKAAALKTTMGRPNAF